MVEFSGKTGPSAARAVTPRSAPSFPLDKAALPRWAGSSAAEATESEGAPLPERFARSWERVPLFPTPTQPSQQVFGRQNPAVGRHALKREATVSPRGAGLGQLGAQAARVARTGASSPLPHQGEAEQRLGHDLSQIEAYSGPAAREACDALGAEAFTVGNTVAFARERPELETVLHEAAHAIQQQGDAQTRAVAIPDRLTVTSRNDDSEHQAHAAEGAHGGKAPALTAGPVRLALRPKKANQAVHLLPALGSPTKLAVLAPNTRVEVTEVLADGLAYRVLVPSLGLSGIVPAYTISELPPEAAAVLPPESAAVAPPARDSHEVYEALREDVLAADHGDEELESKEARLRELEEGFRSEEDRRKAAMDLIAHQPFDPELGAGANQKKKLPPEAMGSDEWVSTYNADPAVQAAPVRDDVRAMLMRAGVPEQVLDQHHFGWGVSVSKEDAQRLNQWIIDHPPKASQYGPREVASQILYDAATGEAEIPFAQMKEHLEKFKGTVVLSPQGYLVEADTGDALPGSRAPGEIEEKDGTFRPGPYALGEFYRVDQMTVYRTGDALEKTGAPIGETSEKGVYTAVLDGIEGAAHKGALAARHTMFHPLDTINSADKELRHLPSTVKKVLETPPLTRAENFVAQPSDVRIEQASEFAAGVGAAVVLGGAAGSPGAGGGLVMLDATSTANAMVLSGAPAIAIPGFAGPLAGAGSLALLRRGDGPVKPPPEKRPPRHREGLTEPSKKPDAKAKPKGDPEVPARPDAETARSIARQNEAAETIAQQGYEVEQLRKANMPGVRDPDYLIGGNIFDAYAPSRAATPKKIWGHVMDKVTESIVGATKRQTTRVLLILDDTTASVSSIVEQFDEARGSLPEGARLDEVLGVKKGRVFRIYPKPMR